MLGIRIALFGKWTQHLHGLSKASGFKGGHAAGEINIG
jgi:hypothetical protein